MFKRKEFKYLRYDEEKDCCFISQRRQFNSDFYISKYNYERCYNFALEMATNNWHRPERPDGIITRTPNQIFADTFTGKLGECAVDQFLHFSNINREELDFETYERGRWDTFDLVAKTKSDSRVTLNIKTTKSKGNLLLLETKDWDSKGFYKPNKINGVYNFIVFARVDFDLSMLMKEKKILLNESISSDKILRELIQKSGEKILYDIVGFITHSDLIQIIADEYIMPQGSFLGYNGTLMDAENFYVQSGDMRMSWELIKYLRNN